MMLARLAEYSGVDLWVYETKDGRSIRRALEYLYPYPVDDREWTYQQIGGFEVKLFFPLMRRTAAHYQDEEVQSR